MIFGRVKPLDAILATAEKKGLHRSLGAFQLTMLGIGAVIGTGIFVLTSEAAQKAGPGMLLSFLVAGFICAVAALCYSELASMVPVSGSAYTYSYAVLGEIVAWLVGWALVLEYAVAASAVFGVSLALGAFLAGAVVSESELSHQAAADALYDEAIAHLPREGGPARLLMWERRPWQQDDGHRAAPRGPCPALPTHSGAKA